MRSFERQADRIFFSIVRISSFLLVLQIAPVLRAHQDTEGCKKAFGKIEIVASNSQTVELERLPEAERIVVGRYGPYDQPLAVMRRDGRSVVYGTLPAVQRAKFNIDRHRDLVLALSGADFDGGTQNGVSVTSHPALAGSGVVTEDFGDLDIETVILAHDPRFKEADLHNGRSRSVGAIARFIQVYVKEIVESGRATFGDFKAGEYDHVPNNPRAQETRSRSIKWTLDEFLAGRKQIVDSGGQEREITLEDAIASESRVKIDWLVEGDAPPVVRDLVGLSRRYYDVTVVFRLAGKTVSGPPTMRLARSNYVPEEGATGGYVATVGTVGTLPIRITTAVFRLEDLDVLARAASIAPGIDLENLNRLTLGIARTYWKQGHPHKVLRRLLMRLYFWNDGYAFARQIGIPGLTGAMIQEEIRSILDSRHLSAVHMLEGIAEQQLAAEAHGVARADASATILERATDYFRTYFPRVTVPRTLSEVVEVSKALVEDIVRDQLQERQLVQRYVEYALNEMEEREIDAPDARKIFSAFLPERSFVDSYRRLLRGAPSRGRKGWVEKYPEFKFSDPSDLHMTIAMHGVNSENANAAFRADFDRLQERIRSIPVQLTGGRFELIGRQGSQIALVFDEDRLPSEVWDAIEEYKTALVRHGLAPDARHGLRFTPHISIAYVRDAYRTANGKRSIIRFFDENSRAPLRMRDTRLEPVIRLLEVMESHDNQIVRRYRDVE